MLPDYILDVFSASLHAQGLRITPQRRAVLQAAATSGGHFDAEALLERVQGVHPRVSKATVYRTLAVLSQTGLVRERDFAAGRKVYEWAFSGGHHHHMVCRLCGEVSEFGSEWIDDLARRVCREIGFEPESHAMVIFGTCARCRT